MNPSMPGSMLHLSLASLKPSPKSMMWLESEAVPFHYHPLTLIERLGKLQGIDELRIETRSDLNSHAAEKQPDVHDT